MFPITSNIRTKLREGIEQELTNPFLAEYVNMVDKALSPTGLPMKEATEVIDSVLDNPNLSIAVKTYLAYNGRYVRRASTWCFEHLEGNSLYDFYMGHLEPSESLIISFASNENLNWDTVVAALTPLEREAAELFFEHLNNKTFKEFSILLFKDRRFLQVPLPTVANKARKVYDIDNSVPDEWIEKMFV